MVNRHVGAAVVSAFVVAAISMGRPASANAGPSERPRGVNARQEHQQDRIRHGVKSDAITRAELTRLRADEARLRAEERRYRESGQGLNKREYKDLQKDLDRVSRQIARATHNDRTSE